MILTDNGFYELFLLLGVDLAVPPTTKYEALCTCLMFGGALILLLFALKFLYKVMASLMTGGRY